MILPLGPTPSPTPLPQLDATQVSPGLAGFLAIFVVAAASVVLFFGLSRQLRRMRHNAQVQGIGPHGPLAEDGAPADDAEAPTYGTADADGRAPHDGAVPPRGTDPS